MSTTEGPPDGVERRRGHLQLAAVMEEVSTLERSVIALATSVTKIIPDQIQVGVAEIRKLFFQIVGALVFFTCVLLLYSVVAVGHLKASIEKGHDVITCFQKVPEGSRTDVALLTCRQASR